MHWIFVGAGNMASSLIGGWIAAGASPDTVTVIDPDENARTRVVERFSINASGSVSEAISLKAANQTGVVIAVKPHIVESVCQQIKDCIGDNCASTQKGQLLVVSVAAGVRASSMEKWLPNDVALVRCMPNTPALLGLGATAMYSNSGCSAEHRELASKLLDTAGLALWVEEESLLDVVTAVSGSGPAYFFYLIEQMSIAAEQLGLDKQTAQTLAIETAFGAASMARSGQSEPAVLRENVTSKGGTTAAALQVFDNLGTPEIVKTAMQAAHDRAVELGDQLGAPGNEHT